MENNFLMTDDMLWDYADGLLAPELRPQVDAYLRTHPEWKTRLDMILSEKDALAALPLEKPAVGFSDRVMAAWTLEYLGSKKPAPGADWMIRGIIGLFGLFILIPFVLMIVAAVQSGAPQVDIPVQMPEIDIYSYLDHPAMHYTVYLGLTYLGLRLLDKWLRQKFTPAV